MRKDQCRCTYPACSNQGDCKACVSYHRDRQEFPACFFSPDTEKTYDRSFDALKKDSRYQ